MIPLYVKAQRAEFAAAKDRATFLLTIKAENSQQIHIEFPGWFAQEFLEQVQNLAARFPKDQSHTPDKTH